MIAYIIRALKRAAILIPGLIVTYFAAKDLYPVFDRRVPEALAIFITYVVTAYVLIPSLIRLYRILVKAKHIPVYCTTPDGFACDPINIGVVGTREELVRAMTMAGWHLADRRTIRNVFRMGVSIILNKPYETAPFSNLYLFGRKQDLGFQVPATDNPSHRHHVRFWMVEEDVEPEHRAHVHFWQEHYPTKGNQVLWVGAASQDIGIRPIRHNGQLTHMIDPDTDAERDLIAKNLKEAEMLASTKTIKAGEPYSLRNRVVGGYMVADGDLKICKLKPLRKHA